MKKTKLLNAYLWIVQLLLALHTGAGAAYKWFRSPAQTMPSFGAIPEGVWLAMSVLELIAVVALITPAFRKQSALLAPIAAAYVIFEMLVLTAVHLGSGSASFGPVIYWLVVVAVCALIIYGRLVLQPQRREFA